MTTITGNTTHGPMNPVGQIHLMDHTRAINSMRGFRTLRATVLAGGIIVLLASAAIMIIRTFHIF